MQLLRKGTRHLEPRYWEAQCATCGSLYRIEQWYRPHEQTCPVCHIAVTLKDWVRCDKDGWVQADECTPPLLTGDVETDRGVGYRYNYGDRMNPWWAPDPDGDGHHITGTRVNKWRFLRS